VRTEGRYRVWDGGPWALYAMPMGLRTLDVAAQDLVTRDQVPVRVKPAATVRVIDPITRLREADADNQAYGAVQLALREAVASRSLEELVTDRDALSADLLARSRANLPAVGYVLERVYVKDVVLPGEIKDLVNRVTLARMEAEAIAIKRREEVAATRQLANTAKLLESNPVLLRLKELEAMGELVGKIDKLVVVGSPELARMVTLRDVD
jgi:regulator of protease activity HflC (stomatin/prohibitin superfamily)